MVDAKVGMEVEIVDRLLLYYYKIPHQRDIISNVLYDPVSKTSSVILKNNFQEYQYPGNLRIIK